MSSRFIMPFADVGSGIKPSSGSKLFFFETDGVTPKNTFSDQLSTPTANTNPVISDSNGVFGDIYIVGSYKIDLQNKNGSQISGGAIIKETATVEDNAFVKNLDTLALAVSEETLQDGDSLNLKERTTGNGGGAMWDVVLSSTVTEDTYGIVQCVGVPTLSLVVRIDGVADVKQFGATSADSTGAIQAAIDTLGVSGVLLIRDIDTQVSGRVDIFNKSKFIVICESGSITQLTNTTRIFNFFESDDVGIFGKGFIANGVGTDFNPALRTTDAEGVRFTSCNRFKCEGMHLKNFGSAGVRWFESFDGIIEDNIIQGTGLDHSNISALDNNQYGLDMYLAVSERITMQNNTIFSVAQGIKTHENTNVFILNNIIYSVIGQHGIYASCKNYLTIAGNQIRDIEANSIKVQIDDINLAVDIEGIEITDNILSDVGNVGIEVVSLAGHLGAGIFDDVLISDNIAIRCGNAPIFTRTIKNLSCHDNTVVDSGAQGIFGDRVNGVIRDNKIKLVNSQAITASPLDGGLLEIIDNSIIDCCRTGSGITDTAIEVAPPGTVTTCSATINNNRLVFETVSCTKSIVALSAKITDLKVQNNNLGDFLMDINVAGLTKFDNNFVKGMQLGSPDTTLAIWGDGGKRLFANTDPATASDTRQYYLGDQVSNIRPATGEPVGWICTASGTPGTWLGFGVIL